MAGQAFGGGLPESIPRAPVAASSVSASPP